ncbi:MAG: ABC transporter substrate-binding protein [Spirochaetales bacterium]|nr:MAG: ABC transporter substrate-binding protein [Spirochaetales bacterium]
MAVAFAVFAGGKQESGSKAPAAEPTKEAPKTTAPAKEIKNPDTFVYAAYGDIDSLDPAKAYDNASGGAITNIYDTLIDFASGSTEKFVPGLAAEVPTAANGLISNGGKTYKFPIRKNVKFHSGNALTPEGVAYSFKRALVTDPDGGPMWMLFEPLFGTYGSRDDDGNVILTLAQLDQAIQVQGDSVVFNLKAPFSPFLSIITYNAMSVIDKDFAIAHGAWNGTQADIARINMPEEGKETLYDTASGTGPYKLVRWEKGVESVYERNEDFWGPKPALKRAITKIVEEWSTRKLMLLQGDADFVVVDPMYYEEMDKEAGLKVYKKLTELSNRGINFNMKITSTDNQAIGSGKLDGKGIPMDFFADKDVRLGFAYAFDFDTYNKEIIKGNGIPAPTPICSGLPFFNPALKLYPFDLKKAEEYFKKAWGGKVWANGFEFEMEFNTGNEVREQTLKMLAETVMSINPKFKVNVRGVEWATYVDMQRQRTMPVFYIGWGADYPDPHNFVQPYMHSTGLFSGRTGYNNPEVDKLVETGVLETDQTKRKAIYMRLQDIWMEDTIGIMLHQPVIQQYAKDWLKGYVFHPMENSPPEFKQFSKGY